MDILTPTGWSDYELIDTGNFEKLERFGSYILSRPEPQAVWAPHLSEKEWKSMAHASFRKEKDKKSLYDQGEHGEWILKPGMPEQWAIGYQYKPMKLRFRLGLTSFKHVGIFPEQAENWNWIYDTLSGMKSPSPRVLNLFAYTGGASLAARIAGAEVTHVDSVRQVISWSRENMEMSGLSDIRWVVEDAMKFIRREVKRGKSYHGIILDPPAYGRGPEGEKWILEEGIYELMGLCKQLLCEKESFLVLNLYSMGFSALIADNLFGDHFGNAPRQTGEFYLPDKAGRKLPLGLFLRSYTQ
jgi:23S rRNA (cytosine1962-C5)-methyltransferase